MRDMQRKAYLSRINMFSMPITMQLKVNECCILQVPSGAVLTPTMPRYKPDYMIFGFEEYAWNPVTRDKLVRVAEEQLRATHKGEHNIGSIWIGTPEDVIDLARVALEVLGHLLNNTFDEPRQDGLTLGEWMEDIDWDEQTRDDSKEGVQPWNVAHAVLYATEIAVNQCLDSWDRDEKFVDPRGQHLSAVTMKDMIVLRPGLHKDSFDISAMLKSTKAFCNAWHSGHKGHPGSGIHFAALVACQASQTVLPSYEERYAETLQ
jgi:hypothetical protein